MIKGLKKKLLTITMASLMVVGSFTGIKVKAEGNFDSLYGVGEGTYWPEQVFAPFVDMTAMTTKPEGYGINGAAYLPKIAEDSGIKFFNLGFIQSAGTVQDGIIQWGWASTTALSEGSNHEQYLGLKKSIKDLRAMGGDVTISFGGLNGVPFWKATSDVDVLVNTYKEIIEGYGLTRIDLDIEGDARDKASNVINAKAIKKIQEETGVEVVLTVPVLPDGLTSLEIGLMDAYLSEGVDIKMVNIMAMCYGSATLLPGENYGTGSVRAIDSTAKQIQECYKTYGNEDISLEEAYRKVGVTTSIGFEGSAHPIFTTEWTQLVVNHAKEKGIGMVSFWSLNRDAKMQDNQGINEQFEHSKICMSFGSQEPNANGNFKPRLYGVQNKKVALNKSFNPLLGVMAVDKEEGDISDKIKVEGTVNTAVAGDYKLIYTVSDSTGLTSKVERTITVATNVPENTLPEIKGVADRITFKGQAFNKMEGISAIDNEDGNITRSIKTEGEVNVNKVGKYKVTYTVTDSDGGTVTATANVIVSNIPPYNAEIYDANVTYKGGEYVLYNGGIYKCKWWIQGENPDTSSAWQFVEDFDMGVDSEETILDLATCASMYRLKKTDANFNEDYDLNKDGIIDIVDIVLIAKNM